MKLKDFIGKTVRVVDKNHPHYNEIAVGIKTRDTPQCIIKQALKLTGAHGSYCVFNISDIELHK